VEGAPVNPHGHHWIRDLKRKRIYERDGWRCIWCGGKLTFRDEQRGDSPTLDHVLPRALGGSNAADNLVTACRHCNQKRRHTTAVEWCGTFPNPGNVFARMLDALMSPLPTRAPRPAT
jgi:hypothetical protein